jgi:hypothetical protein
LQVIKRASKLAAKQGLAESKKAARHHLERYFTALQQCAALLSAYDSTCPHVSPRLIATPTGGLSADNFVC